MGKTSKGYLGYIEQMYRSVREKNGYDILIVVTSSETESAFWTQRLEATRGQIYPEHAVLLVVCEDWPGGAGNLLGTLYAWKTAVHQASQRKIDLDREIASGKRVGMYHTAGKGMRMAPLPGAERNNKSAIKLPRMLDLQGVTVPMTVLEAVIFQTGIFADSREARLCVWWGDQIFVPSSDIRFTGRFHVDILVQIAEVTPDFCNYGLVLTGPQRRVRVLREKQDWQTLQEIVKPVGGKRKAGKSLGSFSLSHHFLSSLMAEFAQELEQQQGKLDIDPHLWQPMTSAQEEYVSRSGEPLIWERAQNLLCSITEHYPEQEFFGYTDIGRDSLWWDYGQLSKYFLNIMKLVERKTSDSREATRRFFRIETGATSSKPPESTGGSPEIVNSILLNSRVSSGRVVDSVLIDTEIEEADIKRSAVLSSQADHVKADGALLYNVIEENSLTAREGEVVTDILRPPRETIRMKIDITSNGKKDWDRTVNDNRFSYRQIHEMMQGAREEDIIRAEKHVRLKHVCRSPIAFFHNAQIHSLSLTPWGGDYLKRLKGIHSLSPPVGESWEISAHPRLPSKFEYRNGKFSDLRELIAFCGKEVLGTAVYQRYGGELPLLVKFIDARENLSVQVHPNNEYALQHEGEPGKVEAWFILDAQPGAVIYLGMKQDVDKKEFLKDISQGTVNIADTYLNLFPVKSGDSFFIAPGTIHAIGAGVVLVEIQQSSGITYRVWDWGRTGLDGKPRELHIKKALDVVNLAASRRSDFAIPMRAAKTQGGIEGQGTAYFLFESPYFRGHRILLGQRAAYRDDASAGFHGWTLINGEVIIYSSRQAHRLVLQAGSSCLIPASAGPYRIEALKPADLIMSTAP